MKLVGYVKRNTKTQFETRKKRAPNKKKPKVFVAISGGVDSAVAAALLKRAGFSVAGVYMKCWTANDPLYSGCTTIDDERTARLVAAHLDIPFYTWNFISEYKQKVVDYMLSGYEQGITPNPDIMCNREIKFGLFYKKARKLGADFVATGHYARVDRKRIPMRLLAGKDQNKDQSYFLALIKPDVLSHVLFPVGNYTKPEVRALARGFGLPNAERKESQGICFIGQVNFDEFLKRYIPSKKGEIVDTEGKVLGKHEGLTYYTIGQRKGIKLSGGPYYVVRKDLKNNKLIVSKKEQDLEGNEIVLNDMNWFVSFEKEKIEGKARIRYRQPLAEAKLEKIDEKNWKLVFNTPQRAVTIGQIATLYQGDVLVGAGIIQGE